MLKKTRTDIAGFSLMEVMISLLILLIGVTSVIALFPIAVFRVRQAVLDTRCTFVARSMWDVVDLKDFSNDPLHRDPSPSPSDGNDANGFEPFLGYDDAGNTYGPYYGENPNSTPRGYNSADVGSAHTDSYHFRIVPAVASPTDPPTIPALGSQLVLNSNADNNSVPILVDPLWVESDNDGDVSINGTDYVAKRQTIAQFKDVAPFNQCCIVPGSGTPFSPGSLWVATTWEAASIENTSDRRAYIRRWFTSAGDILYRDTEPGFPLIPSNTANIDDNDGPFPLAMEASSAQRGYPYSWAYLYQRETGVGGTLPALGEVLQERVLVFYRRNLSAPFTTAVGAFYDGDTRVTLRYEAGAKPELRRGGWLLEYTVSGPTNTDIRRFRFHRISDFEDMLDSTGQAVIAVTLESEPTGYNAGPRPQRDEDGDGTMDDGFPDLPPDPSDAGVPAYSPILILDGLQEVYGRPVF